MSKINTIVRIIIYVIFFLALAFVVKAQAAYAPPYIPPPTPQEYASELVSDVWDENQFQYFNKVVMAESGWNNTAQNPTSTAFGIAQFLDSTWATVGYEKTDDPYIQIDAMVDYIKQRYGDPQSAWSHHIRRNWY